MSFHATISERAPIRTAVAILSADADYFLMLAHVLGRDGYSPLLADTVEDAVALIDRQEATAVLVDCQPGSAMLADLSLRLKQERHPGNVLVIALVAGGVSFIDVLKSDVDESFIRPLNPERLLSYLHTHLDEEPEMANGLAAALHPDFRLDLDARQALANGVPIGLSPIEFRILSTLLQVPGRVVGRPELIEAVWPQRNFVDPRTVDVHMARLRRALHRALGENLIRTVRGEGYAVVTRR